MIVQYCSDLHLEFPENKKYIYENPIPPKGDILILAGDIVPFRIMNKYNDFWDYISANFLYSYWIPGNHEYYYSDILKRSGSFTEKVRNNVFLVNNMSIVHDKTKFIFTTLWTNLSDTNRLIIQQKLSDFSVIKNQEKTISPDDYNQLHHICLQFLKNELLKNDNGKTVVVTHHVPTMLNYPQRYKGDTINEAFVVELYNLIVGSNIDYWIFGHHHQSNCDFVIDKTRLVSSQLGYVRFREHLGFKNNSSFYI